MEDETIAGTVQALTAHIAINVRSVKKSTEFYRKMLGSDPVKTRNGYAKFNIHNPPLNLTLNEAPFNGKGALSHLGIQVASTEDVAKVKQRWQAEGLTIRDEMQTDCCYAVQDKSWVTDPMATSGKYSSYWKIICPKRQDLSSRPAALCRQHRSQFRVSCGYVEGRLADSAT
jgi:hypothetical protein